MVISDWHISWIINNLIEISIIIHAYDSLAVSTVTGVRLKQLEITADNNKTVNSRLRSYCKEMNLLVMSAAELATIICCDSNNCVVILLIFNNE